MKNQLFKSRNGIFEIQHSAILGVIRQTMNEQETAPTLVDSKQVPKGTLVPTGKVNKIKVMSLLTTSGKMALGPEHTAEMEVFLKVHPIEGEGWTCDESQLPDKPSNIVQLGQPN